MFAGNITDVGHIEMAADKGRFVHFIISSNYDPATLKKGNLISCMGVALPIAEKGAATGNRIDEKRSWFSIEVPKEIQMHTLIKLWKRGDILNLERCLKQGDDIKGHIVKGYVDGFAKVIEVRQIGDAYKMTLETASKFMPFIVENGFITLNGLSVTSVDITHNTFSVIIFPQQWLFTTFRHTEVGGRLHLEIDMLARYAAKLVKAGFSQKLLKQEDKESSNNSSKI